MNERRLSRRNARLCPMHALQGPYTRPDLSSPTGKREHWHTRDLVEVRYTKTLASSVALTPIVRTVRCSGPWKRGPVAALAMTYAMATMAQVSR